MINVLIDWLIDDHLHSTILRSLEQTHCSRLWFYMSNKLFIVRFFNIHRSGVLTVLAWLVPHETAAISAQVLCTPDKRAPCHFMQSHIRKVYVCLAVTCHLHFWQNERDLLHATAEHGVGMDTEIRVSTESWPCVGGVRGGMDWRTWPELLSCCG